MIRVFLACAFGATFLLAQPRPAQPGQLDAMNADGAGNILDTLGAHILEVEIELVADLVAHDATYVDAPRIGE